jgi:deoxyribodipyrimidine photo-lyase
MKNVNRKRIKLLNSIERNGEGNFFYWMYREHRLDDNWGLNFALELAGQHGKGIQIIFTLDPFLNERRSSTRGFMLRGLELVKKRAQILGIPFTSIISLNPAEDLTKILEKTQAAGLICDFYPLRHYMNYCHFLSKKLTIPFWEVDSHNIMPCRYLSPKQEYAAYTIRKKIEPFLPEFLEEYPPLEEILNEINLTESKAFQLREGEEYDFGETKLEDWGDCRPGYQEGMNRLLTFLKEKLDIYHLRRNDPNAQVVSGLSPYLHFGQISPQSVAYEAAKYLGFLSLKGGFLDEIIVRRELADNFCLHNEDYDNFNGFPPWAQLTLNIHEQDQREYLYDRDALESAKTHDPLWNAAQLQMVNTGIMHGYMRMYWAKKILEWTVDARTAMKWTVYLNDKYSLDGKDPNGYAGCAWAIGGLHDRPWGERAVFGKIRYMNSRGCERKFDTKKYIEKVITDE